MIKIENLFYIEYGKIFSSLLDYEEGFTPVIKSSSIKNGVIAFLDVDIVHKNVISVARTGSTGSSFYHPYGCYITDDCMVLTPKKEMLKEEFLYYVTIINREKYRFNYARKVTPYRLGKIKISPIDKVPTSFLNIDIKKPSPKAKIKKSFSFNTNKWKWFLYKDIFDIKKGYYNKKPSHTDKGNIPFIGATEYNNGITEYYSLYDIENQHKDERSKEHALKDKIFNGNCITINNGGSIGNAFYQKKDFTCSHHVNPIYLKNRKFTPFIAIFIITLIKLEKYRYLTYGREWRLERMPFSKIKLPADKNENPDWEFMEDYIKSLPYSSNL